MAEIENWQGVFLLPQGSLPLLSHTLTPYGWVEQLVKKDSKGSCKRILVVILLLLSLAKMGLWTVLLCWIHLAMLP